MEPEQLQDRVCVVTGGASGIGLAMARRFARAGMKIVIGDVEQAALSAAVAGLGAEDRVLGLRGDVSSMDDMLALRDLATSRFGGVHVVCLNAGVAPTGTVLDSDLDVWEWVLDVNLRGVVHGAKVFGPVLREQGEGHVLCTASVAGLTDTGTVAAYGVSKHAVVGLAAALRSELATSGVGVSVLCPGAIDTKIFESERNRPVGMRDPSENNPISKQLRDLLATKGATPDRVAEVAYRAVLDNQFFVFPTSDLDAGIRKRLADIEQGFEWRNALGELPA
jgi:NAD(P)-dependent dehydrogenase (short-subunit alcohol dehydrogenase family)